MAESKVSAQQRLKVVGGASLEHTGPGTPAGRYLRRFWQPVYHSVDLKPGRPVPLRIMSEDFTLYRGQGGAVHLVESRCPHRGTPLDWVPDRLFDRTGRYLVCATHGALFQVEDGVCVSGPCFGDQLTPVPLAIEDGVLLAPEEIEEL